MSIQRLVIPPPEILVCPTCGAKFEKLKYQQKFCSKECQSRYWFATHPRVRKAIMPTDRAKRLTNEGLPMPLDKLLTPAEHRAHMRRLAKDKAKAKKS